MYNLNVYRQLSFEIEAIGCSSIVFPTRQTSKSNLHTAASESHFYA